MSFFDDVDEPETTQRAPRRPRGRPPRDQQTIQTRRIVAAVVVVVLIVVIALLVHSCAVSQTNSALQDYNNAVYNNMKGSVATGTRLFNNLSSGESKSNLSGLVTQLDDELAAARSDLSSAQHLSVPGQMSRAQQYVLLALTMRRDGIRLIANNIQSAMTKATSKTGVQNVQQGISNLYASDIVYKSYGVPAIAAALKNAGLSISPTTIYGGQVLQDLAWLNNQSIATKLGANLPSSAANSAAPGLHGHVLLGVSVGSNHLAEGVNNTVASNPAPTFTLSFENGGNFTENDVGCKISIKGLSDTGTATVPRTTAGQTTSCNVTLPSPPTPGVYQVTATIEKVPGEQNVTNNSMTFPITFT